jgi:thioredoxin reductase
MCHPEASVLTLKSGKVLPPAQLTILGIDITTHGHVKVNDHLQTTAPRRWAVGDAVEVNNLLIPGERWAVPLAGPANRQG